MKRKKLSLHVNREVEANEVSSPRVVVHPLVSITDAPAGLQELKVKDSQGKRIGFFQVTASEMDDQLLEDLHDRQARHAHAAANLSLR